MAYRPILSGMRYANLGRHFEGAADAYAEGRAEKQRRVQQEWERKKYEERVEEAKRLKEERELAVKKDVLESQRIRGMTNVQRTVEGGVTGEELAGVYKQEEERYRRAAQKLGTEVDEFAFPDLADITAGPRAAYIPATREQALTRGKEALERTVTPGGPSPELGVEAPLVTGRGRADVSPLEQEIGRAQVTRAATAGPEAGVTKTDQDVASMLDASIPGQGLYRVEFARQHPMWEKFKQLYEEQKTRRAPTGANIDIRIGPTSGFKTEAQKEIKAGYQVQSQLKKALDVIGGTYNPYSQKIEGGEFDELFGWVPRGQRFWSGLKAQVGALTGEDKAKYERMIALRAQIGGINIDLVHEAFGGALTKQEIERTIGRILDENADPVMVRTAMEELYAKLDNVREINLRLMQDEAFKLKKGTAEFDAAVDAEMKRRNLLTIGAAPATPGGSTVPRVEGEKNITEMSDEELDAHIANLEGR